MEKQFTGVFITRIRFCIPFVRKIIFTYYTFSVIVKFYFCKTELFSSAIDAIIIKKFFGDFFTSFLNTAIT